VNDPGRYGVAELLEGKILSIEEKPELPKSNYCVTGIYMYNSSVFDIIKTLKPSKRGELEISDINSGYLEKGLLTFNILSGWWTDAGTFESLTYANMLVEGHFSDRMHEL
jgi:glucose-1-phosphate thymidylyltransferase